MAGGIGSKFWPLSTQKFPKQFQDILGTGRTMIQQTYDRISKIIPRENIFVITNKEYVAISHQQLPEIPEQNIIGEPLMKNTAACNLYMANKISEINPDATIIVVPSDHLILKEDVFLQKVEVAFELANSGDHLVTLGITPTRPDVGYAYLQFVEDQSSDYYKVKTFTEKPVLELAKSFLESGDFLWNSGIFIWSVNSIKKSFDTFLPEMVQQFTSCEYNANSEASCIELIYPKLQKISIDNGILEKAKNVFVIPADLGWSDFGTWTSVFDNSQRDEHDNAVNVKTALTYDSTGNIVHVKKNKAVVIDGLKDFIIVDTDHVLLICPKEHDHQIKDYVLDVKSLKKGENYI